MVLRHAILNGGRGGILSEKRRRRAAQAPGGTGGRVPHFPGLEPKWLLSLSLACLQQFVFLVGAHPNGACSPPFTLRPAPWYQRCIIVADGHCICRKLRVQFVDSRR